MKNTGKKRRRNGECEDDDKDGEGWMTGRDREASLSWCSDSLNGPILVSTFFLPEHHKPVTSVINNICPALFFLAAHTLLALKLWQTYEDEVQFLSFSLWRTQAAQQHLPVRKKNTAARISSLLPSRNLLQNLPMHSACWLSSTSPAINLLPLSSQEAPAYRKIPPLLVDMDDWEWEDWREKKEGKDFWFIV